MPELSWNAIAAGCALTAAAEGPAPIGAVVAAVQAQLADLQAALERPGVTAVAVKLAEVLDNDSAVPQHAASARALIEILGALHKSSARRARLSAVRDMTQRGTDATLSHKP